MTTKEAYLQEVEDQLKALNTETDRLIANVGQVGLNARSHLRHMVQEFSADQATIRKQLETFRQGSDQDWEQRKDGLIELMVNLREDFEQFKKAAQVAGQESIGWAQGLEEKDDVSSIGWAEGLAEEDIVESIGWAEGAAEEDLITSRGWAEGYDQKP